MDALLSEDFAVGSHEVLEPSERRVPMVFASPHSGQNYPLEFIAASRLSPLELRRSEDSFVDEIFSAAPAVGAPLLRAHFPRAFVDPNREPFELDPEMFTDALPAYANTGSPRVAAGLGTIAKVVANGSEIYHGKLTFAEALRRIRGYYWPYHTTLKGLIEQTQRIFGFCLLIDCHSMPSKGMRGKGMNGLENVDFVLGDAFGQACDPRVSECAEENLRAAGYTVVRNNPYAGGFVTRHYGRPDEAVHCLQIEISRRLYMDETCMERSERFSKLKEDIGGLMEDLADLTRQGL